MSDAQRDWAERLDMVPVEYVGPKARKTDTVTGSGVVWDGPHDVQLVPRGIAQRLLVPAHAQIWAPAAASHGTAAPRSSGGDADPQPPGNPNEVIEAIAALLAGADAKQHLTAAGKPKTESIAAVLGRPVSAGERDAAWEQVINGSAGEGAGAE